MGKSYADDEIIEDENYKIIEGVSQLNEDVDNTNNDKIISNSKASGSIKREDEIFESEEAENPVLSRHIEDADVIEEENDDNTNDEKLWEQKNVGNENVAEEEEEDETFNETENIDDSDDDLEAIRLRNIARNQKRLAELLKDAPEFKKEEQKSQRKRHSKPRPTTPLPLERRSSARNRGEPVAYNEYELDKIFGDDDQIRHSRKRSYHEMRIGKENISFRWKVQMRINKRYSAVPELPVSEVTPEHISNISTRAYEKIYSKNGSSCHQCRQKTMDTKTYCRSGQCTGVRGQFCGPCLDGRYGEKVAEALLNPNWSCPPCRGICNCSICLSRQGFAPTGILRPYCIEKGYKSVKHYLEAVQKDIEGDSPNDEISGDSIHSKFAFDIDDFSEEVPDVFEGF